MKFLRRDLLKLGFAQAIVAGVPNVSAGHEEILPAPARKSTPSILQGATDDTRTQFSIVHSQDLRFEVIVSNSKGFSWFTDKTDVVKPADSNMMITKVYFSKLNPKDLFYLSLVDAQTGVLIERREFKTLDLSRSDVRFALCSCMDDRRHEPEIWQDLVKRQPEVIFFIGDSIYVDAKGTDKKENPQDETIRQRMWRRFCEGRATLEIYFSKRLIPILAVWDDHDFVQNDANSVTFPDVEVSQKNFLSFFAQETSHCKNLIRGPGISMAFKLSNHLFVLMDDRSFRQPKGSKDRYGHWGKAQEEWLFRAVRKHNGPVWIMNGSQIFPDFPFKESFCGDHAVQFEGVMNELRALNKKVIFASGDVHFSEISKIEQSMLGYETYEVTSSSVHSKSFPGLMYLMPNPRRIASTTKRNYVLVDSQAVGQSSIANVYSCSAKEQINFAKQIKT